MDGRVCVVVGATAREGVGGAIARQLLRRGATVVCCGRNQEELDVLGYGNRRAVPMRLDLGDAACAASVAQQITRRYEGTVDEVYLVAGSPIFDSDVVREGDHVYIQADGTGPGRFVELLQCEGALSDDARIAIVTSPAAVMSPPDQKIYARARRIVNDWMVDNIPVFASRGQHIMPICMGMVATGMWAHPSAGFPRWVQQLVKVQIAKPEGVAARIIGDLEARLPASYPGTTARVVVWDERGMRVSKRGLFASLPRLAMLFPLFAIGTALRRPVRD